MNMMISYQELVRTFLADGTEHIIQFYEEVPVMLIYLLSAGLTLFFYFIPLKLFFNKN